MFNFDKTDEEFRQDIKDAEKEAHLSDKQTMRTLAVIGLSIGLFVLLIVGYFFYIAYQEGAKNGKPFFDYAFLGKIIGIIIFGIFLRILRKVTK